MPDLAEIVRAGGNAWIYLPVTVLLGALHGLEPGHSKTMMAAYIVAVRGTIAQAVLLGVCAALSHSLVVWVVAAVGLSLGRNIVDERVEAWLLVASGVLILCVALWMLVRVAHMLGWSTASAHSHADHGHSDHGLAGHDHSHEHAHGHHHHHHRHDDDSTHEHRHTHEDGHEREHAAALACQLAGGRHVTNGQIALFGLSGGLIPCPASITVLLICLQLGQFALGMATVAAFSLGLAITLVAVGVAAAWSIRQASQRLTLPANALRLLPFASVALVACIGVYMLGDGVHQLR